MLGIGVTVVMGVRLVIAVTTGELNTIIELGVTLATGDTVELTAILLLKIEDDGIGNGDRSPPVLVNVAPVDVVFKAELKVGLGVVGIDAWKEGTIPPLLTEDGSEELVVGNGERRSSEFVKNVLEINVKFKVGTGVVPGVTIGEELRTEVLGMLTLPVGVVELVVGNGERVASEIEPSELGVVVKFATGGRVGMAGVVELETAVVTFELGVSEARLPTGVEGLVSGKGLRGLSKM